MKQKYIIYSFSLEDSIFPRTQCRSSAHKELELWFFGFCRYFLRALILFTHFSGCCDFSITSRSSLRYENASILYLLLSLLACIKTSLTCPHFLILISMYIHLSRGAFAANQSATTAAMVLSAEYSEFFFTQYTNTRLFIGHPFCLRVFFIWRGVRADTGRYIFLASNSQVSSTAINQDFAEIFHWVRDSDNFIWILVLRNVVNTSVWSIMVSIHFFHLNWIWIFLEDELGIRILVYWCL